MYKVNILAKDMKKINGGVGLYSTVVLHRDTKASFEQKEGASAQEEVA